jgi:peptidyl-prolyl cis-trans isomerase B (cyclophilin B)
VLILKTSEGDIKVELFEKEAPISSENFLKYAQEGFYDGTIFHRVIDGFMVQGGGFSADMKRKSTHPPIKNEAGNGLKNIKYTLAMARTSDPNSATSQFFINTTDNGFLNRAESQDGVGYAVFGKVVEGMDVVDRIGKVKTGTAAGMRDVPVKPVVIESVEMVA